MPIDLPILKIIPISDLILHEEPDPIRSDQLVGKLLQQGSLRNPPLVMPMKSGGKQKMVLDGANRVTAFKSLGDPHILVQFIQFSDPGVSLPSWNHLVWGQSADLLLSCLKQASKKHFEIFDQHTSQFSTKDPNLIQIQCADRKIFSI